MSQRDQSPCVLPFPLPGRRSECIVLVATRRMAAHGIRDAQAALLLLDLFGAGFRRPLVLLRTFILELAQASQRMIKLAPCCAMRMTEDEARLIAVLRSAARDPAGAELVLIQLADNPFVSEPLSAAAVFGRVLEESADPGLPVNWC